MPFQKPSITVLLNTAAADTYIRLINERFPEICAIAAQDEESLERHIADADVLVGQKFPIHLFESARKLRWFQCTNAGIDTVLPIREKATNLIVTNARGIHGDSISDYVMAGVTMLHWDFRRLLNEQAQRRWSPRYVAPLSDKTLGVVGLGAIGATIARRAKAAGMTVVGSKRDISVPIEGVDRLFGSDQLGELLALCDFVVLAVPATPDTVHLIGSKELAAMKPDAFLVNIARGEVVVESDLIEALQSQRIAGAMLDVFQQEPLPYDSPLWTMSNVIATPHIAGAPTNYHERLFEIFAGNVERFLSGQPLNNHVDLARGY